MLRRGQVCVGVCDSRLFVFSQLTNFVQLCDMVTGFSTAASRHRNLCALIARFPEFRVLSQELDGGVLMPFHTKAPSKDGLLIPAFTDDAGVDSFRDELVRSGAPTVCVQLRPLCIIQALTVCHRRCCQSSRPLVSTACSLSKWQPR